MDTLSKTLQDTPRHAPAELPPGTRLGANVVIVRPVGRGGMGMVYLAEDVALKRQVAVKVMSFPDDEAARRRFLREARILAGFEGDAFLRIHDFGEDPATGALFFVMDLCLLSRDEVARVCREILDCPPPIPEAAGDRWCAEDGLAPLTLGDVLAGDRALKPEVAAHLGLRILDALVAIHSADPQIVHRDLKPSNLLFTPSGKLLVSDFGIAKTMRTAPEEATTLTMEGLGPGTPLYAAPEQKAGGEISPATDYYALGLILYRMLSGGLPSAASTALPADISRRVSPQWNRLFARLLDRDPERRLADPAEVRRLLAPLARPPRRTRPAFLVASLLAAAAVALALKLRKSDHSASSAPEPQGRSEVAADAETPPSPAEGAEHGVIAAFDECVARIRSCTTNLVFPVEDQPVVIGPGQTLNWDDFTLANYPSKFVLNGGRILFSRSSKKLLRLLAAASEYRGQVLLPNPDVHFTAHGTPTEAFIASLVPDEKSNLGVQYRPIEVTAAGGVLEAHSWAVGFVDLRPLIGDGTSPLFVLAPGVARARIEFRCDKPVFFQSGSGEQLFADGITCAGTGLRARIDNRSEEPAHPVPERIADRD